MWFFPAGDPVCTKSARTSGACAIWQPEGQPREVGVATLQGNVLAVAWKTGYCTGTTSTYTMVLRGDALNLTELGGCSGGDYVLTRGGTGTAPTAPPPPTP